MRLGAAILVMLALIGPACRSADPVCAGRNAADVTPSETQFRTMSPEERRADAARFNALAQRCGWEP